MSWRNIAGCLLVVCAAVTFSPIAMAEAVSNYVLGITVDGDLSDWLHTEPFSADGNDSLDSTRLDWLQAWMAHDDAHFYLAVHKQGGPDTLWDQSVFIDTDGDSGTGYQQSLPFGADYLIQGTFVYRYTGLADSWQWQFSDEMTAAFDDDYSEYRISRQALGNPQSLQIGFAARDTVVQGGDHYPDGLYNASSPMRYFQYQADAPESAVLLASDQRLTVLAGQARAVTLTASDTDAELVWNLLTAPVHGSLLGVPPELYYQPDPLYAGEDSFRYSVSDGAITSMEAAVFFDVLPVADTGEISNLISGAGAIVIDGNLDEWQASSITWYVDDSTGDNAAINPVDLQRAAVGHDSTLFYMAVAMRPEALPFDEAPNVSIFLDTDASAATGYSGRSAIGADYLLQGNDLFTYDGDGELWAWLPVGSVNQSYRAGNLELSFPRRLVDDPRRIHLVIHGDNYLQGGITDDLYPDGAYHINDDPRYLIYTTTEIAEPTYELAIGGARDRLTAPVLGRLQRMQNAQRLKTTNKELKSGAGTASTLILLLPLYGFFHRRRGGGLTRHVTAYRQRR